MREKSHNRGFTLIEMLICVAIVAITIFIGSRAHIAYQWLSGEANYSAAIRQMTDQKKIISNIPYDKLPPEIFSLPDEGKIKLSQKDILPESLIIIPEEEKGAKKPLDASMYSFDAKDCVVTIKDKDYRGKKILVKYKFLLPDVGEAATIPEKEPYEIRVFNTPVEILKKIDLVDGDKFITIPSEFYRFEGGLISLDKKYAGNVVRLSYIGGTIRNICSGEFLDDSLMPVTRSTDIKLLKIQEAYGAKEKLENAVMKVKE